MTPQNSSQAAVQDQEQARQYFFNRQYSEAAQLYEQLIEIEPEVKSHYWYLGLIFLLQGQEIEAQTTWLLGMEAGTVAEIEAWTVELIQVLEIEAERHRIETGDYKTAWLIRQHIRELDPQSFNNLLHILGLSTLLQTYTDEVLTELEVLNLLKSEQKISIDSALLLQVLNNILDQAPFQDSSYELVELSLPYIEDIQGFMIILIPFIYKIAYSAKQDRLALKYAEQGLKLEPNQPELLRCSASFYQNVRDYQRGIERAKRCFNAMTNLADKTYANLLLMRGLMSAGGHWEEFSTALHKQQTMLESLFQQPNSLQYDSAVRLFATPFFFPYFQDYPRENYQIRSKIAQTAQAAIESSIPETIKKCREWQNFIVREDRKPLRVGYLSHCLRNHSVGWLARWLIHYHNHEDFEIYTYLLASETQSTGLQNWYISKADKAYKLGIDGIEVAEKIAQDQIDILVDLDSITLTNACEVLAIKPAPIQVTWLGWDGSGLPTIDYYLADPYVLPENAQEYYSEKIWRLPETYIAVDGFEVGVSHLKRQSLNIPNDAITYLVTQRGYKYNPNTARLQMRILAEVPNSYFLIKGLADQEALKSFYSELAESEGVSSERLKLLPFSASEAVHRADLAIADIVLDTYPYNGATTTMETLWMGIPMVTRVGQQFSARNSYTMMMNAGITEGIAWTDEEYVEWGIRLGTDEVLRQQVAWKLRQSRQTSPLWNGQQFTREMEKAYQQMWQIYLDQC